MVIPILSHQARTGARCGQAGWFPLRGPLGSFPHSLIPSFPHSLLTSKKNKSDLAGVPRFARGTTSNVSFGRPAQPRSRNLKPVAGTKSLRAFSFAPRGPREGTSGIVACISWPSCCFAFVCVVWCICVVLLFCQKYGSPHQKLRRACAKIRGLPKESACFSVLSRKYENMERVPYLSEQWVSKSKPECPLRRNARPNRYWLSLLDPKTSPG